MLERILEKLMAIINVYEELFEIAKEKNKALRMGDATVLSTLVQKEGALIERASALEEERILYVGMLAKTYGMPEQDLKMSGIIERSEGKIHQQLVNANEVLVGLLKRLKDLNDINGQLVKLHMEYTRVMLEALASREQAGSIYSSAGKVRECSGQDFCIINSKA